MKIEELVRLKTQIPPELFVGKRGFKNKLMRRLEVKQSAKKNPIRYRLNWF